MTAQRQKEANVTVSRDNCWRSQREPEQSEVLSAPRCPDMSKKSLQMRKQRALSSAFVGYLLFAHQEAEEHFWGCSPSPSEPLFELSCQLKESKGFLGWERATNPCGYLPVTNTHFKLYSLKHSEMAQIILEISYHSSLIFKFMSQQTKAFLPPGHSFRPLADSWR